MEYNMQKLTKNIKAREKKPIIALRKNNLAGLVSILVSIRFIK